jgi:hypothetical protein
VATIPIGGACEFQSLEGRYHAVNHDRRFLVVSSCAQRDVSYANDWIAALMLLRLVDKFPERKPLNHKSVENVTYLHRGPCINLVQDAYHGPTRIGLFANY